MGLTGVSRPLHGLSEYLSARTREPQRSKGTLYTYYAVAGRAGGGRRPAMASIGDAAALALIRFTYYVSVKGQP